jgi:hypothetical protein
LTSRSECLPGEDQVIDQVDGCATRRTLVTCGDGVTGGHGSGKFADNEGEVRRTAKNALEIGEAATVPTLTVSKLEGGDAAQHDARERSSQG